jgi:hypothetical protein
MIHETPSALRPIRGRALTLKQGSIALLADDNHTPVWELDLGNQTLMASDEMLSVYFISLPEYPRIGESPVPPVACQLRENSGGCGFVAKTEPQWVRPGPEISEVLPSGTIAHRSARSIIPRRRRSG